MDPKSIESWVDGYLRAWTTNDPDDLAALFTEEAAYFTAPYREPWSGREAIVDGWLGRAPDQGGWEFDYQVLAATEMLGFVKGETRYLDEACTISNLWVIRFDAEGRCSEFTEWWMQHPSPEE